MDSAFLGELVRCHNPVVRLGGLFGLCNAAPRVRELLEITKLRQGIPTFETEDAGVEAFEYGRASQDPGGADRWATRLCIVDRP